MTGIRLTIRKTRLHFSQMMCLVLLLMVGVCFFITLFTISRRYEETAEQYFVDNAYADAYVYGTFNDENVAEIAQKEAVISARGRMVQDYREGEMMYRVISLTDGINLPYIYEGRLSVNAGECLLLRRNAAALGIKVGDSISIEGRKLLVTGLAASPEFIYMVQSERITMARPDSFAVIYVSKDFFPAGYNEILVKGDFSDDEAAVLQKDQPNYSLYRNDLEEISTFAYIFPAIFAMLIAIVVYVMLARTIQKDRRQIGTMKALGMSDGKIIRIYLLQYGLTSFCGGLLGCFLGMFVTDGIIGIFSSMFEVPTLNFIVYPTLWVGAVAGVVVLCAIAELGALYPILSLLPVQGMRPPVPKGGRRSLIERIGFLWQRLSWGSRYALKNSLRNKGRFFAVVLGMCGSCALMVFSLGFYDSIGNTHDKYFSGFANYDVIAVIEPLPLSVEHPLTDQDIDNEFKALIMSAEIRGKNYPIAIVEEGFDMVEVAKEKLADGLILPEYFAGQWEIEVGEVLEVNGIEMKVASISPQYLGLTIYTSFDYVSQVTDEVPQVYNTIYTRGGDITALTGYLKENNIQYSTIDDDRTSFDSIMESMSVLIWFMIACSVILGFTVLYSVGLINLSAREYEYMFMGIMGFPHRGIMAAHSKETLFQLILALPLGFLSGNFLLESIKGEFSGGSFVISAAILPQSYLLSALAVLAVMLIMAVVTSRHIERLDIVEGLKARDE